MKDVPPDLPLEIRQTLEAEHSGILAKKQDYTQKAEDHDSRCGDVTEGSALDAECAGIQEALDGEAEEYRGLVRVFNGKVDQAVAENATAMPVNPQNVLSDRSAM